MGFVFHSELSNDLSLILNDSDDFNVIIQVGDNQNTKEFHAHSVILRARSLYFKSALSSDWITKKNDMIMFNKPNITPTVFSMVLKYIYTGELDLNKQLGEDVLGLLVASDELLIEGLFKHVQDYLIENKSHWIHQNFGHFLHIVFKLAHCKELQDHCLELICKDPQSFFTSDLFLSLDKNVLLATLKKENLLIEEVIIWDCLIKWGIKQTPELENKNKHDEWTDENYEDLKDTLSDFVPLIKFLDIIPEDFYNKVRPYKGIIPNNLYEEALEYYLVDQPKLYSHVIMPQIKSNIIKPELAVIIANWIDRNESVLSSNNKFKFQLLYSMSRDGLNHITFYSKCNGQGPFVVLIRVTSKEIYGGYNPIGYAKKRSGWLSSTESFIFSFENGNMKIGRVINEKLAVFDNTNYPCFFNFGKTLYINGKNLFLNNKTKNYSEIFVKNINLPIEEIEVFSVCN